MYNPGSTNRKSLNHRFFFGDLTKVDKLCHENVRAHRIRELQNHFPSRISMQFLLLDMTEAVGKRWSLLGNLLAGLHRVHHQNIFRCSHSPLIFIGRCFARLHKFAGVRAAFSAIHHWDLDCLSLNVNECFRIADQPPNIISSYNFEPKLTAKPPKTEEDLT
jgi:hypothetical protein